MGFVSCLGTCFGCNRPFSYNPVKVPSIRVDGVKHAVCGDCMARRNEVRVEAGLKPDPIDPEAYTACDESEVL
jgi:hypothetical protein